MDSSSSKYEGATLVKESFDTAKGLPRTYGDTKIVILPKDPLLFYAFWEVAPATYGKIREKLGENNFNSSRWALRVYDVTGVKFDGTNANRYFDIVIGFNSDSRYVNAGEVNRSWCVDIGVLTPEGEFIVIARSNILVMPRQGVSPITDEQWGKLQQEFERLLKFSGLEQTGRSSFDITKLMRQRWEEIVCISLPSSQGGDIIGRNK